MNEQAKHLEDSEILERLSEILEHADDPQISPKLARFGYSLDDLNHDRELLTKALGYRRIREEAAGKSHAAYVAENRAEDLARNAFFHLHRVIRQAQRHNPDLLLTPVLQLEQLPEDQEGFIKYGSALLKRIESHSAIEAALAVLGVDGERRSELRVLLKTIRQAGMDQEREQDEAREAREHYHEVMAQLRISYRTLHLIAREALVNDLQWMRLMGFRE
ncbi:MAG: hypothetical protein ACLFU8_13660 [Anaerolineales bacterium]